MGSSIWKGPRSLASMVIDHVVNNLPSYANNNFEALDLLPVNLKNKLLKRFTMSSYFWKNVNFAQVLTAILNNETYSLDLTCATINDEVLKALSQSKKLKKLFLSRSGDNVSTQGLMSLLSQLHNLRHLVITDCKEVNDEVLECLAENCPLLCALDLGGCCNITDVGVQFLSRLKQLFWITLAKTQISDVGIAYLTEGESGLKIKELRINHCSNVTKEGLHAITENCPNLEVLIFYNCSCKDTNFSTFQESNFKNLRQLTWTISW